MTESASKLVSQYRALPFPSDHLGDCVENHAKPNYIRDLDEYANDPSVSQLLLDILVAPNEYDLARIEAVKVVGLYVDKSSTLEHQLKRQLWAIFSNPDEDELVRQHASQNFSIGFGGDDELSTIERLLFDDDDDIDVRHGAFSYLRIANNQEFLTRIQSRLANHQEWGKYVGEVLPE